MNVALISSRGGHLGQIKIIFTDEVLGENKTILITESEKGKDIKENYYLNKHRAYFFNKDYLGFNPFRYIWTIFAFMKIFKKEKTQILFTNGAQISIPAVIAGRLTGVKAVFIDTVIRVNMPNWSARASYLFSDIFLVQHPNMIKKYGKKARYVGGVL